MRARVTDYPPRTTFHTASEKLFGKSEWVPNRGSESGQEESKESRSAASWRQRCALKTPSAIFQTVSEGGFSEVRLLAHPRGLLCRCTFAYGAEPKGHEYLPYNDRPDVGPLNEPYQWSLAWRSHDDPDQRGQCQH